MKYYGFDGVLIIEIVYEYVFHVITKLNIKAICKNTSDFSSHTYFVDLYTVLIATRVIRQWKLRHTQGYRRKYRLLMGPKRRVRTDDTPVGPLFN